MKKSLQYIVDQSYQEAESYRSLEEGGKKRECCLGVSGSALETNRTFNLGLVG